MHSKRKNLNYLKMDRISRHDYYKEAALLISRRSSCLKQQVGAILVNDGRIIAQGYNGVLPGIDPNEGMDEEGNTHTVHAEANIIAFCAKKGIKTEGATMYITLSPCEKCAELIIQAGIFQVYYLTSYRNSIGIDMLKRHGLEPTQIK